MTMEFLVGLLVAWSALCFYVGLLAGCWRGRRTAFGSGAESMKGDAGQMKGDAEPMKGDVNTDPPPPCASPVPRRSPQMSTAATGRQPLYHTDAEGTMVHTNPHCRGLRNRRRDRQLVSRWPCSLCCGGVQIIEP